MSNPDIVSTPLSTIYLCSFVSFIFLLVLLVFIYYYNRYTYNYYLYLIVPVAYLFSVSSGFIIQYMQYHQIENIPSIFVRALPSIGFTIIALVLSEIAIFRIPVASLFSGLLKKSQKCCETSPMLLEKLEKEHPAVRLVSYAFYLLWGTIFGMTWV